MITDAEIIFWIVANVICWGGLVAVLIVGKKRWGDDE